jgi:hypothetical protein
LALVDGKTMMAKQLIPRTASCAIIRAHPLPPDKGFIWVKGRRILKAFVAGNAALFAAL